MYKWLRAITRLLFILQASLLLCLVLMLLPGLAQARSQVSSFFFKFILWGCGIQVQSDVPLPKIESHRRMLIVANHVSYLDILIVCALYPCVFLAKSEVADWPVFGWVARALGCVFVRRNSLMGRACALRKCLATNRLSSIAIFPEGTTTAETLPDAKAWTRGHAWLAQQSQIEAILCLGIAFENQTERAWTDETSLLPHLLKTLGEKHIRVSINGTWAPVNPKSHRNNLAQATLQSVCASVKHACFE